MATAVLKSDKRFIFTPPVFGDRLQDYRQTLVTVESRVLMSSRRGVCTSLLRDMSTQRSEEQQASENAPPIVPVNSDGAALAEFLSKKSATAELARGAEAVVPAARHRSKALVAMSIVLLAAGFFRVAPWGRITGAGRAAQAPRVRQAQETKSPVAPASPAEPIGTSGHAQIAQAV